MSDDEGIAEVFALVVKLGLRVAKLPLAKHYEGCWTYDLGDGWAVGLNGHREAKSWEGVEVPKMSLAVLYNGWLAGILTPNGGAIVAGEAANEDSLIASLQREIAKVGA